MHPHHLARHGRHDRLGRVLHLLQCVLEDPRRAGGIFRGGNFLEDADIRARAEMARITRDYHRRDLGVLIRPADGIAKCFQQREADGIQRRCVEAQNTYPVRYVGFDHLLKSPE